MNAVTQELNKGVQTVASGITYDRTGRMTSVAFGNGLVQSHTYDAAGRIGNITATGIMNLAYSYDRNGNITAITDFIETAKSKTYNYDALNRLATATGPWGNLAWNYDANGNRLSQQSAAVYNYTYDANRLATVTNGEVNSYQHDGAGSVTFDGTKDFVYVYDQNNRLIAAGESGTLLDEYAYNGKSERTIKTTAQAWPGSSSPQMTVFHYDINGRLIAETAGNGSLVGDYIYLSGQPLALIRKQENLDRTYYYHNDHLGTPKVMTDKLQSIVWNIDFDPFGNDISINGREGEYIRNVTNNLRFPGQYFDEETGLHYNYFRDYDPKIGRYIEADPIGLDGGINLYNYTGSNPVNRTDPYGLAYFAKRPLQGSPWLGALSCNSIDDYLNTEISHEQLFFEDGKSPSNIGFFSDGTLKTEPSPSGYQCKSGKYNDCIMRKAVQKVSLQPYSLLGLGSSNKNNCQDWAAEVRQEYNRLANDPTGKCECKL